MEGQEVIIYFALGRGKIGSAPGMVYMYDDAFILPAPVLPRNPTTRPQKQYEIQIADP